MSSVKDPATYTPSALSACLNVLGTLVKAIGAQYDARIVVVGGLVPNLLMDEKALDPLFAGDKHAGTNDVDLCIELDLRAEEDAMYQCLESTLLRYSFTKVKRNRPEPEKWSWVRSSDTASVIVDLLCDRDSVCAGKAGRVARDEESGQGDSIGALRMQGAHLAFVDPVHREIIIELLDGGGRSKVTVRVANILAFIVLKCFALKGRVEQKDAYDLVWVLMRWNGGPRAAAAAARSCSGADHEDVASALAILADEFGSTDMSGCVGYASFSMALERLTDSDARATRQRDAKGTVDEFLRGWQDAQPSVAAD
jgi:hypothetical protein